MEELEREENRTPWLIALGVLVALCLASLLCVLAVGGFGLMNLRNGEIVLENGEQPAPGQPTRPKESNELVIPGGEPPTLDPALASDATSANYIVELFSGLVSLDPATLEVVPDIASEWTSSADGTVYTFTLRDGVAFADGSAVSAEDFKFSIERACDPSTQSPVADTYLGDIVGCRDKLRGSASEVSGVRALDAQTLELTIDAPKVYFLAKLTYPTAYVVDQEAVEAGGRLWATSRPNGTGPFMLEAYSFGAELTLVPNPNYYGTPKPSVERVTFLLSGGSGMTLYETDEIDVIGVGLADMERVLDPSSPLNSQVQEVESLSIGYIGMNVNQPPFDDPLVRQAFNFAIDKERIANVVLEDTVTPAYGIVPPGMPGHNPNIEGLRFDPERARELLTQSRYGGAEGLPDITLRVAGGGGGAVGPETEAMVEMWRQNLGVEVAIEQTEWATFLGDINREPNPYQLFSLGWIADYPDPENFLDLLFHCDSQQNQTDYCNPQVDQLLDQARVEQDSEARMALYNQAETLIVQEAAWLPLWYSKGYALVKPWVRGYQFPSTIVPVLKYVEIDHD